MSEYAVYFDDVNVEDLGIRMRTGHEHPLLAGTRDMTTTIPGVAGAYDYGADLESIPFNLPFQVDKETPIKLQRTLRGIKSILLDGKGKPRYFKLRFGYEPDRYYNVRYNSGIPLDRLIGGRGRFDIPLICFEGFSQSVAKNNEINWWSESIDWYSSYTWEQRGGNTVQVNRSTVVNEFVNGSDQKPIIHVNGRGLNVTIGWGGKVINLGSFISAEWVIDLEEREVSRNGANAMHLIKGDWLTIELQQGNNEVTINGSGLNLTYSVEYRDRYF